ncbi:MAG: transporter substrate-binding domain-containing protein [Bacteroidales bacterium]
MQGIRFNHIFLIVLLCFSFKSVWAKDSLKPGSDQFTDTITIGSEPDYPPYCIVDADGNATGFSVELLNAAAKSVGLETKVKLGVWKNIKTELIRGGVEALPLVGRTPERSELFDFTMSYITLHGAIFVRKGYKEITSVEDLKSKDVLVMKGDNAEEYLRREQLYGKLYTTNTYKQAFQLLAAGGYDAVVSQRVMGVELLKDIGIRSVEPLDMQMDGFSQEFCFAVQKNDTSLLEKLNEGLSIVIADGTYEDLRYEWFGPVDKKMTTRDIWIMVVKVLIPLVLILVVLWIVFLRKEVKRRTRRLNAEIAQHKKTLHQLKRNRKELEKNENQIRLLLNSTAEGLIGIDVDGRCTFVNTSARRLLKYRFEDELLGKELHDLIHHTGVDRVTHKAEECEIFRVLREGVVSHVDSEVFWRTDGTSFPVEYFTHPVIKDGEITGALLSFWDITKRKKTEHELLMLKEQLQEQVKERTAELEEKVKKLNKSQKAMLFMVEDLNEVTAQLKAERKKLTHSNEELEAFTYSVSHDLRAPLRAIKGFISYLKEDYFEVLDEEGQRFVKTIQENADQMDTLIIDLLALSRVSRSGMNFSDVNMEAIIQKVYDDLASEQEKKEFQFNIQPLPQVKGDSSLIKQIWKNLIENALKYSSKSPTRQIEIGTIQKQGYWVFYVKDYGVGFKQELEDRIFQPFYRLHRNKDFEGSGIGLAIAKRIANRHGGAIWAESKPGQGATFYFSIRK